MGAFDLDGRTSLRTDANVADISNDSSLC